MCSGMSGLALAKSSEDEDEAGSSWSRTMGTVEIRPPGFAKHSDTTESDLVESSGGAGPPLRRTLRAS